LALSNKKNPRYKINPGQVSQDGVPSFGRHGDTEVYPAFSFKKICIGNGCMKKCDHGQLKGIADKLRILSNLTWKQIDIDRREQHGYEKLPQSALRVSLVGKDESVMIFRFKGGRGGRIAGVKEGNVFSVLFIESTFGDLYSH
jgi:hypothetical protein